MQIILGPFHPHLEDALVDETLRYKKNRPLAPILILVPSDALRRRLKILLARERGLNFLNLHVLTFYQLSLRLLEEDEGPSALALHDNALLEEVLRQTVRMRLPGAAAFAGLEEKAGGAAALWQTIRDLKDGAVDPAVVLEAARGNLFEEATGTVEPLFTLLQTFLSGCEQWKLRDYADLDRAAVEHVAGSIYLKQFERVFYYGFYDLTQVQLDIFTAVARQYPTTLLFPLVHDHPAWTFAERFYERYAHGLAGGESATRDLARERGMASHPSLLPLFTDGAVNGLETNLDGNVATFSCFGGREEIDAVAKEILRLVSEENLAFADIGVVARAIEPHLPWFREIFAKHCIPVATSAEEPLVQHPLAKAALLLVNLPLKDFVRSHVIDLVDSPFFKFPSRGRTVPRPDLWDVATRRLGVGKGIEEWRRLEKYLARDIVAAESDDEEGELRKFNVPGEQVRALWNLFTELRGDLESFPKEAPWSRYVTAWRELQTKWLDLEAAETGAAAQAIADVLDRLSTLDAVNATVTLAHFLETYQHWIERATVPSADRNVDGVSVLDAMAARGVSFRALFIVGLNEGIFPRTIREDAFLRDRERVLLETVLGYKIATKLGGFDEERLLFTLLVGAARERLYCTHARNDENGRPLASSWYLDDLVRALGKENVRSVFVPRGTVDKAALAPFDRPESLPSEELAIRLILTSRDPAPLVDLCLPAPSVYVRGRNVLRRLEATGEPLAEHDGIVGPVAEYWERIAAEGLSPTALETYARCPFQFFARNLLGLERLERPEEIAGPGAAELGLIVHAILRAFYQDLIDRKYFPAAQNPVNTRATLEAMTQKVFREFERDNPVGYPLAWDILQENIAALLEQTVARDLAELAASGYIPHALERDATVRLPESWPSPLNAIGVRGRMDRIDFQPKENRYRVVDYKLKLAKSRRPEDNDLLRSALRGSRLQLPFYLLLAETQTERRAGAPASIEAAFYFLAPAWPDGPLAVETLGGSAWNGRTGMRLKETVAFLAESIRRGWFFIQPDDYCRYCEVSEACRKNHRPTRWRAERDTRAKAHLELKRKDASER
jgi:ATP-dependent helicase/nuclease subunit B